MSKWDEIRMAVNSFYGDHIKGTPLEGLAKTVLPAAALAASAEALPILAAKVGPVVAGALTGAADGVTMGSVSEKTGTGSTAKDAATGAAGGALFGAIGPMVAKIGEAVKKFKGLIKMPNGSLAEIEMPAGTLNVSQNVSKDLPTYAKPNFNPDEALSLTQERIRNGGAERLQSEILKGSPEEIEKMEREDA